MGLDGALARSGATGSSGSSTASTRRSGTRPTDADLAAPYSRADRPGKAACRADLLARRRASIRTIRGRCIGDDRPARSAEGLRPAGRRRAGAARAGRPARRPGQRRPRRWPDRSGRSPRANPDRVALIERFDRATGPADLRGRRPVRHAVALRAVRAGPDDRPALRDAADRPPDRRPGRHGHRRVDATRGTGPGFAFDDADGRRRCSRRATPPSRLLAAGGAGWAGLLDRGMAVDFDWRPVPRRATSRPTGGRSRSARNGTPCPARSAAHRPDP